MDTTKGVSVTNTITGAGADANAAWIGDDAWSSSTLFDFLAGQRGDRARTPG